MEKDPSLKTGGLYHKDLTTPFITPDTMYSHPILTSLTLLSLLVKYSHFDPLFT